MSKKIPTRLYLAEDEIPTSWFNIRAFMKDKPAPLLHPGTLKPVTEADLAPVFCKEAIKQELDETTPFIKIPDGLQEFYRAYRPAPLIRAHFLEKVLGTPAEIYYKFEGNKESPEQAPGY
jgi:tryptophan synthase beta chain